MLRQRPGYRIIGMVFKLNGLVASRLLIRTGNKDHSSQIVELVGDVAVQILAHQHLPELEVVLSFGAISIAVAHIRWISMHYVVILVHHAQSLAIRVLGTSDLLEVPVLIVLHVVDGDVVL